MRAKHINEETLFRLRAEFSNDEDKVKNLLHQSWGAFYSTYPNFEKLKRKVSKAIESGEEKKEILLRLLRIHSSTNERLGYIDKFYNEIFKITGKPDSILDIGCGFNPLAVPWMNLPSDTKYTALDIDTAQMDFIQFMNPNVNVITGDALIDKFEYADVIFMFKLIPVLEKVQKNFDWNTFLKRFKCKYFVITFPTESLSGKNKGMLDFYSTKTGGILHTNNIRFEKLNFENELVYVIYYPYD